MLPSKTLLIPLAIVFATSLPASAQSKKPAKAASTKPAKIAWYGTWKQGLAEAKRTDRPILLISAAPHCRNISGMW